MKTLNEYPATHSMTTSWFAVDEEGNVAIIEYNENGPVPNGTPESTESEIVMDIMSCKEEDKPWRTLYLTDDEIRCILADSQSVEDENYDYIYGLLVRVPHSRKIEFTRLARLMDDDLTVCLDKEETLFYLEDWFGCSPEKYTSIKAALKSGVFKPIRKLFIEDAEYNVVMKGLPFFFYRQPYEPGCTVRRVVFPKYAMTEERLSEEARKKAYRLPLKFRNCENIQIAEFMPYSGYGLTTRTTGGRYYRAIHTAEGTEAFIAPESIIYAGCGKQCRLCYSKNDHHGITYAYQKGRYPTVMIIKGIKEIPYEFLCNFESPYGNAVFLPIVEGLPEEDRFGSSNKNIEDYPIMYMFQFCRLNLEKNIRFFKPRVILLYKEIITFIEAFYRIEDGMLDIAGDRYPVFIFEDIDWHIDEINALAQLPYRGRDIDWIISKEKIYDDKKGDI